MKSRNAGLDVVRTIAILLVLILHSNILLAPEFDISPYLKLPDGVDVFFVLSGFLIGRIIILSIINNSSWTFNQFADFIQRRWFRTLPNYFLFLLINIFLVYGGYLNGMLNTNTAAYFVFMQNFHKQLDLFFWESWSLSIEEWFYMLFPLVLIALSYLVKNKKTAIMLALLLFIGAPLLIRIYKSSFYPADWLLWDLYFRKLVITRLDSIAIGVLGAFVYLYYYKVWSLIKIPGLIVGMGLLYYLHNNRFEEITFFTKTFYFTLNSLAVLLIFPALESYKAENVPLKPFSFLSDISYSIYLCHMPVMYLSIYFFEVTSTSAILIRYVGCIIIIIVFSYLLFKYFELPLKNLRDSVSKKIHV